MEKKDLKNGMLVETRNGDIYLLIHERFIHETGFNYFQEYANNLKFPTNSNFDIVRVYEYNPNKPACLAKDLWDIKYYNLIWSEIKEMSVSEIEKLLKMEPGTLRIKN